MINCDINCDTVELLDFYVAQIVGILGKPPPPPPFPKNSNPRQKTNLERVFFLKTKNRRNHEIICPPIIKNHTIHKN